jgi:hypothetical protein
MTSIIQRSDYTFLKSGLKPDRKTNGAERLSDVLSLSVSVSVSPSYTLSLCVSVFP